MFSQICFDSLRAVNCNEANDKAASQAGKSSRVAPNNGGVLCCGGMSQRARNLRGVWFGSRPLFSLQ